MIRKLTLLTLLAALVFTAALIQLTKAQMSATKVNNYYSQEARYITIQVKVDGIALPNVEVKACGTRESIPVWNWTETIGYTNYQGLVIWIPPYAAIQENWMYYVWARMGQFDYKDRGFFLMAGSTQSIWTIELPAPALFGSYIIYVGLILPILPFCLFRFYNELIKYRRKHIEGA